MPDWDASDWARFLICLFIGLILLDVGINAILNPPTFYAPIVGVIVIALGLFLICFGASPEDTLGFFEAILDFLKDLF